MLIGKVSLEQGSVEYCTIEELQNTAGGSIT